MKYAVRLPTEYQTVFISDAISKDDELEETPEFTKWALANKSVIL